MNLFNLRGGKKKEIEAQSSKAKVLVFHLQCKWRCIYRAQNRSVSLLQTRKRKKRREAKKSQNQRNVERKTEAYLKERECVFQGERERKKEIMVKREDHCRLVMYD